jgi:cell division protein ZapA
MATVELEIASRRYAIACRDGEEDHLRSAAAIVDGKAREAAEALGSLPEARQLLFASLLLADELEGRSQDGAAVARPVADPALAIALERLAERMETLAETLETGPGSS